MERLCRSWCRVGRPASSEPPPVINRLFGSCAGLCDERDVVSILLAHKWEPDHDPTGWWMSEKLDGVRAYWDGEAFVSRRGNQFGSSRSSAVTK